MTTFASLPATAVNPVYRVALRAALRRLDAVASGWRARVNPATLDMADGYRCVLGQLFGGYVEGIQALETDDLGEDLLVAAAFSCDFPVELWLAELVPAVAEEVTQ